MSLLEVKNLSIMFGGLCAVDDFNLEVEQGELIAIIGIGTREKRFHPVPKNCWLIPESRQLTWVHNNRNAIVSKRKTAKVSRL